MSDFWQCEHPENSIVLKRRFIGPNHFNNVMYGNQCDVCGRLVGKWVKRNSIDGDANALPEWDYSLENKFREHCWEVRDQKREEIVATHGILAFGKRVKQDTDFWDHYNRYLTSEAWQHKRAMVMKRANGMCEGCGLHEADQVHHLTYDRVGREMLFDLVAICHECHEALHGVEPKVMQC